nr:YifB family Mg chelatase-like AAA ATPase [Natronoglycomyces albus]
MNAPTADYFPGQEYTSESDTHRDSVVDQGGIPPQPGAASKGKGRLDRYARSTGLTLLGASGTVVTVEATVGRPSPSGGKVFLSGLPDSSVNQAQTRARAAMSNSGLTFPDGDVSVNFGPASVPTTGTSCDLAFACAIVCAAGNAPTERLEGTAMFAELGLDGSLRGVLGVLPALLAARAAGIRRVLVSADNATEAQLVDGLTIFAPADLGMVIDWLRGSAELPSPPPPEPHVTPSLPDMADLRGQAMARQALEVAAAGRHHMFLQGPPGAGKTMLAERLPSLLPPLTDEEALEVTSVHSLAGTLPPNCGLIRHPPFQAPHHTTTAPALIGGGGHHLRPGAVPLAHRGVLFLDEAPEFKRDVLDALRQPLESGETVIHRAKHTATFPSQVQLILAANPCPCASAKSHQCVCPGNTRRRYLARLSGPLMDRVDIHLRVPTVAASAIVGDQPAGESSADMAKRVLLARMIAAERWGKSGQSWQVNGAVPGPALRSQPWRLPTSATQEANTLLEKGRISGRGYDRVLRLAWTLSDLAGQTIPSRDDVAAACEMRIGFPVR